MPVTEIFDYKVPFFFKNAHLHTIIPSLFRKVSLPEPEHHVFETSDNDFIECDRYSANNKIVALIFHGLEGNSGKAYVKGISRVLLKNHIDAVAVNFKGCSGKPNRQPGSYHAGKTEEVHFLIESVLKVFAYRRIILVGFSLGGNVVLKFAGERGNNIQPSVLAVVGISVPCDLEASSFKLAKPSNFLYKMKFLKSLKRKAIDKLNQFPEIKISKADVLKSSDFKEFDDAFTAPVHGFSNALEYWEKSSCKQFLTNISVPALLIMAKDDPFLSPECFPVQEAETNQNLNLVLTPFGGHVGFTQNHLLKRDFWHEEKAIEFIKTILVE